MMDKVITLLSVVAVICSAAVPFFVNKNNKAQEIKMKAIELNYQYKLKAYSEILLYFLNCIKQDTKEEDTEQIKPYLATAILLSNGVMEDKLSNMLVYINGNKGKSPEFLDALTELHLELKKEFEIL